MIIGEDVPRIVALLADDVLGAARQGNLSGAIDEAWWTALDQVQALEKVSRRARVRVFADGTVEPL